MSTITKETASLIWNCHNEIESGKALLDEIEKNVFAGADPAPPDHWGRRRCNLELGVPTGSNGHRLLDVAPRLALSVIRAHIANKEAELVMVCERARVEMDTPSRPPDVVMG